MIINDSVFGELEYDDGWIKYTTIEFFGQETEIALMVSGEKERGFLEKQYAAYNAFLQNWTSIQQTVLQSMLDYYKQERQNLGYDIEFNEDYPLIETFEQLLYKIELVGVNVPYLKSLEGRCIGLCFDCAWDEENGLGLLLIDEQVNEVGYQDVAL